MNSIKAFLLVLMISLNAGCVSSAAGAATSAAIEVAKIPFKVAGAVIGSALPDKDKKEESD